MGKLHGLPMGVDVCYTNHMRADQNDMDNLSVLLAAAGVNFLIGVPMADDCMLNYQSTSFHDIATLRETLALHPTPAFERWMEQMGLMQDGHLTSIAGDPTFFMSRREG
jgi:ethanolamine ammonia-lyase large subunit